VLDLDESAAFWLAAGEAQRIDLRAPLQRPAAEIENAPPWLISWVGLPNRFRIFRQASKNRAKSRKPLSHRANSQTRDVGSSG
jgi:hypothetical protein